MNSFHFTLVQSLFKLSKDRMFFMVNGSRSEVHHSSSGMPSMSRQILRNSSFIKLEKSVTDNT